MPRVLIDFSVLFLPLFLFKFLGFIWMLLLLIGFFFFIR